MLAAFTWRGAQGCRREKRESGERTNCMRILTTCLMVALGLATTQATASADQTPRLHGMWNVSVTVRNCETGDVIRNVRAEPLRA